MALILLLGLAAGGAAFAQPLASTEPHTFEMESLNRRYSMPGSDFAPVRQGPITIHLSSPQNVLTVMGHSLRLEPVGDGTYRAEAEVDFLGRGDVVAIFETVAGTRSRTEDKLLAPRQVLRVDGRVRFQRVPTGWEVTALELPAEARVEILSGVGKSLLDACWSLAAFLGLDCDGLDRSLTHPALPLPEPGSVFFLDEADLTAEEVRALDTYLGLEDPLP